MALIAQFWDWLAKQNSPRVLDCGAAAWDGNPARHHRDEVRLHCPSATWIGTDAKPDPDVSIVADLHELTRHVEPVQAILCVSTLEHVARPWIVADELAKSLLPGGRMFVHSHQAFPLHGYPDDYFRFSKEAFGVLWGEHNGCEVHAQYEYRAKVIPLENNSQAWNFEAEAWLNVVAIVRRLC